METKTEVFKKLEELATVLTPAEPKNRCWWDTKLCPFYSEVKGFQDATLRCRQCGRVDEKRFFFVFKELALRDFLYGIKLEEIPDFKDAIEKVGEKAREEGEKEGWERGEERAYNEIRTHLDDFIAKVKSCVKQK